MTRSRLVPVAFPPARTVSTATVEAFVVVAAIATAVGLSGCSAASTDPLATEGEVSALVDGATSELDAQAKAHAQALRGDHFSAVRRDRFPVEVFGSHAAQG